MQRRLRYSLFALLFLAVNAVAQTNTAAIKQELETNYTKMAAAMKAKDWQAVLKFIAKNYRQISPNGDVSDRGILAADLEQTMEVMRTVTASYRILKLAVQGEQAVADIRYVFSGKTEPDERGVSHTISLNAPLRVLWVKTAEGWRIKQNEELAGTVALMDGKPIKRQR